jgi:hypothetical protein
MKSIRLFALITGFFLLLCGRIESVQAKNLYSDCQVDALPPVALTSSGLEIPGNGLLQTISVITGSSFPVRTSGPHFKLFSHFSYGMELNPISQTNFIAEENIIAFHLSLFLFHRVLRI